jgi:hypothetical protein
VNRVSAARLLRLADDLGEGERTAVEVVAKLRLVSHAQLAALLGPLHPAPAPLRGVGQDKGEKSIGPAERADRRYLSTRSRSRTRVRSSALGRV